MVTLWLWLTVRHGFSMALIEIDGLPNLKIVNFQDMFHYQRVQILTIIQQNYPTLVVEMFGGKW